MTQVELITRLEAYKPAGWTMYASHNKDMYNYEKQITDTVQVVLPNNYPATWRGGCYHNIDLSLWFGKVVSIKRSTTGTQQHNPYASLEERDDMFDIANTMLALINTDSALMTLGTELFRFYDSPDGRGVNRQLWLEVPLRLRVWEV